MATSGNLPSAAFEGGHFERGLTIEDAERFAASFKPSWEFDEAPFTAGQSGVGGHAMSANDVDLLGAGGVNADIRAEIRRNYDSGRSQAAAPHAPAPRVESHEPEVSVIIDRTITAAEMERAGYVAPLNGASGTNSAKIEPTVPVVLSAQTQSAPPPAFAAPVMAAPVLAAQVLTSSPGMAPAPTSPSGRPPPPAPMKASSRPPPPPKPVAVAAKVAAPAYNPNDSLEIEVRKSNKPLFLGIGAAVALALAVLGIRAATTSSDPEPGAATPSVTTAAGHDEARIPPPPAATGDLRASTGSTSGTPVTPTPAAATPAPAIPAAAAITHAPTPVHAAPHVAASPPPRPAPRAATPHAPAAPKSPPKPATGGIVRDVPF